MAKASVEKVETNVKLSLSKEEAIALIVILGNIGGCLGTTPRKYTEKVYRELEKLISVQDSYEYLEVNGLYSLYWKNNTLNKFNKTVKEVEL